MVAAPHQCQRARPLRPELGQKPRPGRLSMTPLQAAFTTTTQPQARFVSRAGCGRAQPPSAHGLYCRQILRACSPPRTKPLSPFAFRRHRGKSLRMLETFRLLSLLRRPPPLELSIVFMQPSAQPSPPPKWQPSTVGLIVTLRWPPRNFAACWGLEAQGRRWPAQELARA